MIVPKMSGRRRVVGTERTKSVADLRTAMTRRIFAKRQLSFE
jgi:hypothetical protein